MRLFAHENVDIAISVLEVLVELTGEDVDLEKESDMQALIDEIFKDDSVEYMIGNLDRLDESKDDDRRGVFHTLSRLHACPANNSNYRKHHILQSVVYRAITPFINQMASCTYLNKGKTSIAE